MTHTYFLPQENRKKNEKNSRMQTILNNNATMHKISIERCEEIIVQRTIYNL